MNRKFYSIDDIKTANRQAGQHYFEASTMRFFRSRVSEDIFPVDGHGAYFITSEQYQSMSGALEPRLYTVRHAAPDGSCDTVGEFQAYSSGRQAKREALRLSLLDHDGGTQS